MFGRRFESAHLHKKEFDRLIKTPFFVEINFLTPVASRQPLLGAHRPLTLFGSGVPAASTFYESLADADDAALMRLIKPVFSIFMKTLLSFLPKFAA